MASNLSRSVLGADDHHSRFGALLTKRNRQIGGEDLGSAHVPDQQTSASRSGPSRVARPSTGETATALMGT